MRIISYIQKDSGVHYHRLIVPLMLMAKEYGTDIFITNDFQESHYEKGCDIVFYSRVLPDDIIPRLQAMKEKYGFKVVVDIDDLWELDEHHILYQTYLDDDYAGRQIKQLQEADMVITTHERLAMEVMPYNQNVHVCPNAIARQGQFNVDTIRDKDGLVRLFWQGSNTHKADIEILRTPVNVLHSISEKIKMVFAGYVEGEEELYRMVMAYTAGAKHQYKLIQFEPVTSYYKAYAEADICLVPLVNSKFNRHKSPLKVLEAANMGLPVIASQVNPYLDMPLLYCNNSSDWIKHIKSMVRSRGNRREQGSRLKEWVDEHYNFGKINLMRKQIFEYVASRQGVS